MADPAPELLDHSSLYDEDFYQWIQRQMGLLRAGHFDRLDLDNLIEELDSMGRSEKKSVVSNTRIVLLHLLKLRFQAEKRSGGWLASIVEHRERLRDDLRTSPSLRRYAHEMLEECYAGARKLAAAETGLPRETFPEQCPFTFEQLMDEDFLPE